MDAGAAGERVFSAREREFRKMLPKMLPNRSLSKCSFRKTGRNLLISLAVPRGLHELSPIKDLPKSGTLNHSMGSLGILMRVSHLPGSAERISIFKFNSPPSHSASVPINVRCCPKADKICGAANVRYGPISDMNL
jgi:hypothetical protein